MSNNYIIENEKKICFIHQKEFEKLKKKKIQKYSLAKLYSQMCRINTLSMVKLAGSGHLGTSFSAMDLMIWVKHFFSCNKKIIKTMIEIFFFHLKDMMLQLYIQFCIH